MVEKDEILCLGMERDRALRTKKARVDDLRRQNAVKTAREHVYAAGRPISGTAVEKILGKQSRVPTLVRHFILIKFSL